MARVEKTHTMQTFRTSAYIVKIGGFWDRMKNREGLPQGEKIDNVDAPWTPQDMAGSYGGELSDEGMAPIPPNPQDVAPLTPEEMAQSYGGEPEGELGANPKPGTQEPAPGPNVPPKEKARFLHSVFQKLMQGTGDMVDMMLNAASQTARDYADLFNDEQVARWYAKFLASQLGEEVEGRFYLKYDDPKFDDEFERMKAQLPPNVQQNLDRIMGRGGEF